MTTETAPRLSQPRPWLVGVAVIGGIAVWAGRFTVGYLLVPTACLVGEWLLHVVHAAFVVAGAGTVVLAAVLLRRHETTAGVHFLLLLGLGLNVFFLGAIVLESTGTFFVDACAKGAIP